MLQKHSDLQKCDLWQLSSKYRQYYVSNEIYNHALGGSMATMPAFAAAGYQFEATPDLSKLETRERLSQSAMDGLFAIVDKWQLPMERVGDLLGGMPRSTLY